MFNVSKYKPLPVISFTERTWPNKTITKAPIWCSVDLRDGNQALIEPMGQERKLRFFETLVRIGFKEIEVGFPSASQTDFDFVRLLIEQERIPKDVTIQVLTQARKHLIDRTFESLKGAPRAVVHLYNSTSPAQRKFVFNKGRKDILDIAIGGTRMVQQGAQTIPDTEIILEYSPESFSATELDFAAEVSNAVIDIWQPTAERKMILNLPATVESASPNVYADQIEWMNGHINKRDAVIVSVHTHNDRGCAVAAAELAMMAGAKRVEGTLFGNGERTGNADIVTIAMNMYVQGIDPKLDLSDMSSLVEVFENCNLMSVPPRHPYAGELVFTAFSGSHQDAIRKGINARSKDPNEVWQVPYLPLDPADIGRQYEPIIRINSQSGKGGIGFVLEHNYGYRVPKGLAIAFSQVVQNITDQTGKELELSAIFELFDREYIQQNGKWSLISYTVEHIMSNSNSSKISANESDTLCHIKAEISTIDNIVKINGTGTGPLDAFMHALHHGLDQKVGIVDYSEHALGDGADAEAVAYVELSFADKQKQFGVGRDRDIVNASLQAVVSALNRY
ncbi:MAG: 2-isopropylmalate synthase [Deltaproteobacteria bacterium]|nr:2-isopropylmalate synthase [Deltaproteobacteria bacterium]